MAIVPCRSPSAAAVRRAYQRPSPGISRKPMSPPATTSQEFRLNKNEGEALDDRRRAQSRHVHGRADRRRDRHHARQGFRRHHEAAQFRGRHEDSRQLGVASRAGLHRAASDAGPRVQGQAHVGPHGRAQPHHRKSANRGSRRAPQPAADQRRRARIRGRPGDRAAVGQGASQARRRRLVPNKAPTAAKAPRRPLRLAKAAGKAEKK